MAEKRYSDEYEKLFADAEKRDREQKRAADEAEHRRNVKMSRIKEKYSPMLIDVMRQIKIAFQVDYEHGGIKEYENFRKCAYNFIHAELEDYLSEESENNRAMEKYANELHEKQKQKEREDNKRFNAMYEEVFNK